MEETGETLEENARLKAVALVEATGLAAMADDTGLEVEALGGAPGVYSARFAGPDATYADNVVKLLDELASVGATGPTARRARFRTVAIACFPDGARDRGPRSGRGRHRRRAAGAAEASGTTPCSSPTASDGRTYAEMSMAEKGTHSHRGRAFRALAAGLRLR